MNMLRRFSLVALLVGLVAMMIPDDLSAQMVRALMSKVPQVKAGDVEDLMMGCGQPAGEQGFNIARVVAIWEDCRTRFAKEGPYLFGRFSLADAAFAPVAFRFQTYGVKPAGAAGEYLATLLANPHMQDWTAAARAETESIPEEDLYG